MSRGPHGWILRAAARRIVHMAPTTSDHDPSARRRAAYAALGLSAVAGRWLVLHRRAPAVRTWRPGGGERRDAGELSVRTAGDGDRAVILLHGLITSGDYFGAPYDRLDDDARLVIPDLLGFGRSLDVRRDDHGLQAQLAALDAMARELRLDGRPLTVAGHSLGGLLALHWAARRSDVERVVCFSTPLYLDASEADARISAMGGVERLYATQGPLPRALSGLMSRRRALAQWVVAAIEPRWPVAITRMAVHHTWASYLGAMNGVIRDSSWQAALGALEAAGIPVLLADGAGDRAPVPGRAAELAQRHTNVAAEIHPGAGHQLPITHPQWCVDRIAMPALRS